MIRLLLLVLFLTTYSRQVVPETGLPMSSDENQIKRFLTLYTNAHDMTWNAAGTIIITAALGTVRVWDTEILEQLYFVHHNQEMNGVQFNTDEDRFLTWSNSEIRLWETETGNLLGKLQAPDGSNFRGVAWHGNHILNWYGAVIGLWDGYAVENVAAVVVGGDSFIPHRGNVSWNQARTHFLTWNAEGAEIPIVRMWAVQGRLDDILPIATFQHEDEQIDGAEWSPDETMIVSWSQNRVSIWDAETADLLHVLNTASYVTTVRWSPNSQYILVEDIRENAARVWDVHTGQEVLATAGTDAIWDTTGERLLVGRQTITLFHVATGDEITHFGPSLGLGFALWNSDGVRLLVETAFGVQVWIIPPQNQCVVHTLTPANLRTGPDINSDQVDMLPAHQLGYVTDQALDEYNDIWWQLADELWVHSEVVEESGQCFMK